MNAYMPMSKEYYESRAQMNFLPRMLPRCFYDLVIQIAIVRPGPIQGNMVHPYIKRRQGKESVEFPSNPLKKILNKTLGIPLFQEQAMQIAQKIAGFNLQDADVLRKAIGKKKADLMAEVKKQFIDGAKKANIVNEEEAEEIFGWIEKSQRYSFNKSHAISYAMNAYLSAYVKAHFPSRFFVSYLKFAKDKIDPLAEIYELVSNCREMGIEVCNPNFCLLYTSPSPRDVEESR